MYHWLPLERFSGLTLSPCLAAAIAPLTWPYSLLISAGLAVNVEQATTSDTTTTSLEGTFAADYILFKYDSPKADITTGLDFFPSITEQGRFRMQYDIKLRYEVVSDLFVDLSFYVDYDNQPASGGPANTDYQIVTSVGWSY